MRETEMERQILAIVEGCGHEMVSIASYRRGLSRVVDVTSRTPALGLGLMNRFVAPTRKRLVRDVQAWADADLL